MIDTIRSIAGTIFQVNNIAPVAKNVTGAMSIPGELFQGSKLINNVCAPPQVKYPLKCAVLVAQLAICISTGGTVSTAIALNAAHQILLSEV